MFALIVTILSIALVAALAVATIFYGGEIMRNAKARATASTVVAQGQQILGASQVFKTTYGRWPDSLNELVTSGMLKSIPVAPSNSAEYSGLISTAYAAPMNWQMVSPGVPYYWLHSDVDTPVCQSVNKQVRGDNGIYRAAIPSLASQCFGEVDNKYTVIVGIPNATTGTGIGEIIKSADPGIIVHDDGGGWELPPDDGTDPTLPPLSSDAVDFGLVPVGTPSTQVVTLTNRSDSNVTVSSITGLPATVVRETTGTSTCGAAGFTLAPQASCNIVLTFTPVNTTGVSGTIAINSDYAGYPVLNIAASGTGAPSGPIAALGPTALNFTDQVINSGQEMLTVTITNNGNQNLTVSNATVDDTTNYTVVRKCPTPLAQNGNCIVEVTFAPKSVGSKPGVLTITSNAPQSPQYVPLAGVGIEAVGTVSTLPGTNCPMSQIGLSQSTLTIYGAYGSSCANLGQSAPVAFVTAPTSSACPSGQVMASSFNPVYHSPSGKVLTSGECKLSSGSTTIQYAFFWNPTTNTVKGVKLTGTNGRTSTAGSIDGTTAYVSENGATIFAADFDTETLSTYKTAADTKFFTPIVDANNPANIWSINNGSLHFYDGATKTVTSRAITMANGAALPFSPSVSANGWRAVMAKDGTIYASYFTYLYKVTTADAKMTIIAGSGTQGKTNGVGTNARFWGIMDVLLYENENSLLLPDSTVGLRKYKIR